MDPAVTGVGLLLALARHVFDVGQCVTMFVQYDRSLVTVGRLNVETRTRSIASALDVNV